jgi:hypothetical protein
MQKRGRHRRDGVSRCGGIAGVSRRAQHPTHEERGLIPKCTLSAPSAIRAVDELWNAPPGQEAHRPLRGVRLSRARRVIRIEAQAPGRRLRQYADAADANRQRCKTGRASVARNRAPVDAEGSYTRQLARDADGSISPCSFSRVAASVVRSGTPTPSVAKTDCYRILPACG